MNKVDKFITENLKPTEKIVVIDSDMSPMEDSSVFYFSYKGQDCEFYYYYYEDRYLDNYRFGANEDGSIPKFEPEEENYLVDFFCKFAIESK